MSVDTQLQFDREYVTKFSKDANEPEWFLNQRLSSLELVGTKQLPKPDKTNIEKWNFSQFTHTVEPAGAELPEEIKGLISEEADQNVLAQRNGQLAFSKLSDSLKEQGVIFTDFQTAIRDHSDLVQKYFMKEAVTQDENSLTAMHGALVNGGTFIYVPKNVDVQIPLQAIYAISGGSGFFNHILIVADENSTVTYVENYVSEDNETAVANIIAEVYALQGATVSFGAVDNFASGVTTYVVRRGHAERDAKILWALGQLNDGNTVSENKTFLVGEGSFTDKKTVTIGTGEQRQNFTSHVVHYGKHSEGIILTHGVMKDSASSIFNGISKIEHGASKSNGVQTERVLMLSEKARGDANPILLIDEDDVTAGHAASVGRIDPLQMFYLMSRGIPKKEAERLVIHGFLAPVVKEMPVEAVKTRLIEVIERKVN
ncbi:Fe-S cluster assembly protein SufD [Anaerobacillus isosaccharinicus]|uniref:Fe-S cluster assembly protein SufD n=1 Tax=Anaerobacillus isosaccharinicus TaxID=1532552 RepID=A0A1S2KVU8_9BACI|nr:Fe-S cluster assembly protein SufD [Anaerobacillus isosaccharinicus]MBA5584805.1 Fe-S cluster assembly protein SufD [Anaerobacillus isosaccharinicus]QOY36830.1 Fe-S cluster assembly protein SufD [Anaerobacillus isosaccharinicus]